MNLARLPAPDRVRRRERANASAGCGTGIRKPWSVPAGKVAHAAVDHPWNWADFAEAGAGRLAWRQQASYHGVQAS